MTQPPGWDPDQNPYGGGYGHNPQYPGQQGPPPGRYGPDQTQQLPPQPYGPPDQTRQLPPQPYGPEPTQQLPPQPYGPPDQTQQLPPQPYGPPPYQGGPPGYLGPPMPPPASRNSRAPLLIGLVVLLLGAIIGAMLFFTSRNDKGANTASSSTPTATATATGPSPSPSASPTASETPTTSESATSAGNDSEAPSDVEAQTAAQGFMSNLKNKSYDQARLRLCDAGQERFTSGEALQKELGLDTKSVAAYTITKVVKKDFNGDPRKEVTVKVALTPNGNDTLTLSITKEHGEARVCGF